MKTVGQLLCVTIDNSYARVRSFQGRTFALSGVMNRIAGYDCLTWDLIPLNFPLTLVDEGFSIAKHLVDQEGPFALVYQSGNWTSYQRPVSPPSQEAPTEVHWWSLPT